MVHKHLNVYALVSTCRNGRMAKLYNCATTTRNTVNGFGLTEPVLGAVERATVEIVDERNNNNSSNDAPRRADNDDDEYNGLPNTCKPHYFEFSFILCFFCHLSKT